MFSLPSSRHLVMPLVGLTVFAMLFRFLTILRFDVHGSIEAAIISQLPRGISVQHLISKQFSHAGGSDIFDIHTKPLPNKYIAPLLKCPFKVNHITNAIRIPSPILNITLTSPDLPHDPAKAYFNPTLIPLPPHSPYSYLLLSRLVTEGLHQESHVCLATLCLPEHHSERQIENSTISSSAGINRALPPDARSCTPDDLALLGPHGGIRCATAPEKLNIPPTPALRCEGAWAAFPDIPGFHDPRVFWSRSGEPLVIVNSGSQYGCVGLWIVDLRVVYGELADLMGRKGVYAKGGGSEDVEAKVKYPDLTELTRNSRNQRGMVEKNWVLFFPKGEESWIMFDLVGHGGLRWGSGQGEDTKGLLRGDLNLTAAMEEEVEMAVNRSVKTDKMSHNVSRSTLSTSAVNGHDTHSLLDSKVDAANGNRSNIIINRYRRPRNLEKSAARNGELKLKPARTLAKLLGAGYTSSNLTAPNESPCLTSDHILDSRGATGHWHQGSNSLRLVLCTRHDLTCLEADNEDELVRQGKIVHFAILHRKFSNDLKLPMRYERYVMVWEARYPFRMIGISRHPILFAGERAQPWSIVENGLVGDAEADMWKNVYFTYTPSLAWSWRRESVMTDDRRLGSGQDTGQGTGHIGDEVIVGIGMDDVTQGVVRVKVEELLSCLRLCPDIECKE